jgi:hypothetical protein
LCGTTFVWEAEAQPARSTFEPGWLATGREPRTIRSTPRDRQWGRPGHGALPAHMAHSLAGALASRCAARQLLIAQPGYFIRATHALDDTRLPPQDHLAGSTGQGPGERGGRCLQDPCFLASSRDLKQPKRLITLLMVMTVCWLVYAALAYRLRPARQEQGATFPDPQGNRPQHPTTRWGFPSFVEIHVRFMPQQWPLVITLTAEP